MFRSLRLPLLLISLVAVALLANAQDYTCWCRRSALPANDWSAGESRRCFYANSPSETCENAVDLAKVSQPDEDGWNFLHHAAAAGNIKAFQMLVDHTKEIHSSMFEPRLSGMAPKLPKGTKTLEGVKNVWGWQPIHVAAAFNQGALIRHILSLPYPINAMLLRYRLEAEDRYNRTAFVVAVDEGATSAATALTEPPFSAPDVEAMVMFRFNLFARAQLAGKEMEEWYGGFVTKRKKDAATWITSFYSPWPLPKILKTKEGRDRFNATRISVDYTPQPQRAISTRLAARLSAPRLRAKTSVYCASRRLYGLRRLLLLLRSSPDEDFSSGKMTMLNILLRQHHPGLKAADQPGIPRHEIGYYLKSFDKNHDGRLSPRERDMFIREIMNRETGGVKELLGFRMPTKRLAIELGFDKNEDGWIDYEGGEEFTEDMHERFNKAILEESILLENRVIRTQQSARLSTSVTFNFSQYTMEKLGIPKWVDFQFQVINSVPPGEHYGHHDDGAFRIFTVFLYCKAASEGGATAFPFAISMHNGSEWTAEDEKNYQHYRMMGIGDIYPHHVHLHEKCEVERDCCDPDCHAMYRGRLPWARDEDCIDDDASLRANAISAMILQKYPQLDGTCKNAAKYGLCKHKRMGWDVRLLCPVSCKSCKQKRKVARDTDLAPRVVPTSGSVKAWAKPGDVLIWPNYEHQPNGEVNKLNEAGFKMPTHFLDGAMQYVIREEVEAAAAQLVEEGGVGTSKELQSTLEALDKALGRMMEIEARFNRSHAGLQWPPRRCSTFEGLMRGDGDVLLDEALSLEYTAFKDRGARRMYHFKEQFVWKDLSAASVCKDTDGWCEDANSECDAVASEGACRDPRVRLECPAACGTCFPSTTLKSMEIYIALNCAVHSSTPTQI
eukprot:jgi/Bigna1/83998/fgenesh1_pg.120_\